MGVAGDLSALAGAGRIVSKRIGPGTQNMAGGPAMSPVEAVRALEAGIELARDLGETVDVFGTGDMGIGNTTASAAIAAAITGRAVADVTGRGTGIDDEQLRHKVAVIQRALEVNRPDPKDGLDVLAKVGGFEIGGLAGLILGAAAQRKPVVLDGFISTAGALVAYTLAPTVGDYLVAGHRSQEKGHEVMLEHLGKKPLLDLGLRLGEGTGAALAMNLMDAAVRILTEVATFAEASVSQAPR
jgi:nicotinate-nucleotide--dimethylbenzimidazole phosphoribosyltransferase